MSLITTVTRMWLTRSFKPFVFKKEYDNRLHYSKVENLGLYIHIPFCKKICSFCPYCKVLYNAQLADQYVDSLLKEIEMVGSVYHKKKKVTSLYFGGGSPALLSNRIEEIINQLKKYYIITEGIGIELHPENVTVDTLQRLKLAGITKISIGIQSFQTECLNMLGRGETNYQNMFAAINQVEFDTVSMDLIFALPGQTAEILKRDIDTAFHHGANHIAIYPFIDFSFTKNQSKQVDETHKKQLLYEITKYCREKGYVRDSIWTFAKKHTKKYSSMTRDNFLGFGCSATTLLPDQFKINTFSIEEYIKRNNNKKLPTSLTLHFSTRQRMIYYLFWRAYTTKVDPNAFEQFFGSSLQSNYRFELWLAGKLGYIKKKNGIYCMTTKGAYYYHYYEQFYTLSYIDKMWSVMGKEAFPNEIILM